MADEFSTLEEAYMMKLVSIVYRCTGKNVDCKNCPAYIICNSEEEDEV